MGCLQTIDRALGSLLRAIPVFCLSVLFALLLGNVLSRFFQIWSIAWFDEIVQGLFSWIVFIGAAALWRENEHFRVDWLESLLPQRSFARMLRIVVAVLCLSFLALMTWKGLDLTLRSRAVTPILNFPVAVLYVAIPIAGAIMCAYSILDIIVTVRGHAPSAKKPNRETAA